MTHWRIRLHLLVLAMVIAALIPLSTGRAASSDTPISPPASVFVLPSSVVGGKTQVYKPSSLPPDWLADAVFSAPGGVGYEVRTFSSSAEAMSNNTSMDRSYSNYRRLAIPRPVAAGEWARLGHGGYVGSAWDKHLAVIDTGLAYRNILILVTFSEKDPAAPAAVSRAESRTIAHALTVTARLLGRAQAYASHVHAPTAVGRPFFPTASALLLPAYLIGGQTQVETLLPDPHGGRTGMVIAYGLTLPTQGEPGPTSLNVTEYRTAAAAQHDRMALAHYVADGARVARRTHPLIATEWVVWTHRHMIDKAALLEGAIGFTYHNIGLYVVTVVNEPPSSAAARRLTVRIDGALTHMATLYLQHLEMIASNSPRTPLALAQPKPKPVERTLTVAVSVSPNPTTDGTLTEVDATTLPGASCEVAVRYASGYKATSYSLKMVEVADSSGSVSWTWTPATSYPGPARAEVWCTKGSQSAGGVGSFSVE